jgi:hypothetical protein
LFNQFSFLFRKNKKGAEEEGQGANYYTMQEGLDGFVFN